VTSMCDDMTILNSQGGKKNENKKNIYIFPFIWWLKKIVSNEYLIQGEDKL